MPPPSATDAFVRTLLGPHCPACGVLLDRPVSQPVCGACWMAMPQVAPPWCDRCGDSLPPGTGTPVCGRCRLLPRGFAVARSAGRYEGPLRTLIHALKYRRRRIIAASLARFMADACADLFEDADAVVPVPLHPWRALSRGFNQADDLARAVGPPVWRVLRRRHLGHPQARLPADRRRANVRDAFVLAWRIDARRLQGATLVLVDDVMTTGETLDACSEPLLRAGVRIVRAVTAARAVAGPPRPPPSRRPPW